MSFEIRTPTAEQVPAFRQTISMSFGDDVDTDEAAAARFAAIFDLDRMYAAVDDEAIVGTGGDFGLVVTVPGGAQVAMSGLTIISILPTHTRQGILTAMMRRHFDLARERGELLGGLWASEVPIYSRFGYGPSTLLHKLEFDARQTGRGGNEPDVNVKIVDGDEAAQILPVVYAEAQRGRPGMLQRTSDWWKHRLFYDPESWRGGASSLRHAVAIEGGIPRGYVSYRQKGNWELLAEGEVRIQELIPATDSAYRSLWHFLTSIDLFPNVKVWNSPADDPIRLLLRDGRAVATKSVSDSLWTRLIDVPDALTQRTYQTDGAFVMRIADDFCEWNDGTYRLAVSDGSASCDRVVAEPDVSMSVGALGALYLGGRDAPSLARAGMLSGDHKSISALGSMFRTSPDPWCAEIF